MKTYKLIKEYPGSPELGTIVNRKCTTDIWKGTTYYETYPEFWQEVVEKDYEILISRVVPKEILSVKRLSDGEVFTVGDLVKTPYTDCTRITGFNIEHSTEYFIEISTKCCTGISTGFTRLLSLEKVKQPIFLTHDGKDIFDGDKAWYVNKENFYYDYIITHSGVKFYSDLNAYFLTRQEAEDYIKKNKVIFTTEDGVEVRYGDEVWWVTSDSKIMREAKWDGGNKCYESNKYFSTRATAEYYVIQNSKSLSIEDFWEITGMSTSNFNKNTYMKDLVKERLGIK